METFRKNKQLALCLTLKWRSIKGLNGCLETFLCGLLSLVVSAVEEADMLQLLLLLFSLPLSSNIRHEQVHIGIGTISMQ